MRATATPALPQCCGTSSVQAVDDDSSKVHGLVDHTNSNGIYLLGVVWMPSASYHSEYDRNKTAIAWRILALCSVSVGKQEFFLDNMHKCGRLHHVV